MWLKKFFVPMSFECFARRTAQLGVEGQRRDLWFGHAATGGTGGSLLVHQVEHIGFKLRPGRVPGRDVVAVGEAASPQARRFSARLCARLGAGAASEIASPITASVG